MSQRVVASSGPTLVRKQRNLRVRWEGEV